jgi:hypothetical protein
VLFLAERAARSLGIARARRLRRRRRGGSWTAANRAAEVCCALPRDYATRCAKTQI